MKTETGIVIAAHDSQLESTITNNKKEQTINNSIIETYSITSNATYVMEIVSKIARDYRSSPDYSRQKKTRKVVTNQKKKKKKRNG